MMVVGAIAGFATTLGTGSHMLGVVAAALAGMLVATLFALLTVTLLANQVAAGLALTMFGLGISALWGQSYTGLSIEPFPKLYVPGLSDLPIVGKLVFSLDPLVSTSRSRW